MPRADTHVLTVHLPEGRRYSYVGSEKECEAEAKRLKAKTYTIDSRGK